jgi:hypothetical protein
MCLTEKAASEEACVIWNRFSFCFEKLQSGIASRFSDSGVGNRQLQLGSRHFSRNGTRSRD